MLVEVGPNQPVSRLREARSLAEVMTKAESYCKDCKSSSPMVCMERCDVWRVKHEVLETRRLVGESHHSKHLLNVLKNRRRLAILGRLCETPLSLKELQRSLRGMGFIHSQSTIRLAYVKPMMQVGLVREEADRLKVTFYGRKVHDTLHGLGSFEQLQMHSCCYEETVLKELAKPRTFNELAAHVPRKSLSRILMRLRMKGLLTKSMNKRYVYYHRAKNKTRKKLSPTERRMFKLIPPEGIPVKQLSKIVGINQRRTYKYLYRLREKNLIIALRANRTYELTQAGQQVLNALTEIGNLAASDLNVPAPLAKVSS
jgi:DNA-binding HxlR family transcriptional regulator/predicted transcriptional regulator